MITFKQKEFSSKTTQFIFKAKQAGNAVTGALKLAPKKSKIQVAREAIQLKNELKPEAIKSKALGAAIDTARKVESAIYNPGQALNKGIEFAVTKPAAAATAGAWMGTIPYVPGTTSASVAVEKVAQKIPAYKRVTEKLGTTWKNSKASKKLQNISNADVVRYINMIPIA